MELKTTLAGKTFVFGSIKEVLAKANEEKSGDVLAGVAAGSGVAVAPGADVVTGSSLSAVRSKSRSPK